MSEVTFRDFAGALMRGDLPAASGTLETLLGLAPPAALAASEFFRGRMTDPAFVPRAMSLRTAVQAGTDAEIDALLADCFGLDATARPAAIAALRTRYPAPA